MGVGFGFGMGSVVLSLAGGRSPLPIVALPKIKRRFETMPVSKSGDSPTNLKPRSRGISLSLLAVLSGILIVGGFYAVARWNVQKQWSVVNELKGLGGNFDPAFPDVRKVGERGGPEPAWKKSLGIAAPQDLVKFSLYNAKGEVVPIAKLALLPQLEEVHLLQEGATDEDLAIVAQLPQLKVVQVYSDRVTDEGIAHLAKNANLQKVELRGTGIRDQGLASVAQLANLQTLEWDNRYAAQADFSALKSKQSLVALTLRGNSHWDAGLAVASTCENLESLCLGYGQITAEGMRSLAGMKKLKRLELYEVAFPREELSAIAGLTQLEELRIDGELAEEDLAVLGSLTSMQTLRLQKAKITGAGLKHLASMKQLKNLDAPLNLLGDEDMKLFDGLQNLESLDLRNSQVTDAGLLNLPKFLNMMHIELQGTQVTAEGANQIRKRFPKVISMGIP